MLKGVIAIIVVLVLLSLFLNMEMFKSEGINGLTDNALRQAGADQTSSVPLFSQSSRELNIDGRDPSNVSLPYSKSLPPYVGDLYPDAVHAFTVSNNAWEYDRYGLAY